MESTNNRFGTSLQAFIAIRKEANEAAEMTSQVLFGESVEILNSTEKWHYIRCLTDNYEGWISKNCLTEVNKTSICDNISISNYNSIKNIKSNQILQLPTGSSLPEIKDNMFILADEEYEIVTQDKIGKVGYFHIDELLRNVLSIPYLWGGKCGFGFDCSGLSQYICRALGNKIPRDASEQAKEGIAINFLSEAKAGDLAFFDNDEGEIIHVGIILDNMRILHSSGYVRIDKFDQQGIFNSDLGKYTHHLRIIKTL